MYTVYLYDRLVGVIERRGTGLRFTYAHSALNDDAFPALSLSLPKRLFEVARLVTAGSAGSGGPAPARHQRQADEAQEVAIRSA